MVGRRGKDNSLGREFFLNGVGSVWLNLFRIDHYIVGTHDRTQLFDHLRLGGASCLASTGLKMN